MAFKTLYKSSALSPGARLWILPELHKNSWAKNIDWYLNLQISKARLHTPSQLSEELQKILSENEWDLPTPVNENEAPLMVACSGRIPCDQIIKIDNKNSLKDWVDEVFKIWKQIETPSLRVFLPDDCSENDFTNHWPENPDHHSNITLVPSSSGTGV